MIDLMKGDCLELMKNIPDGSVDMVLTSPPYDKLRNYNNSLVWSYDIFKMVASEITRVLKKGGVIVWVVGDATVKGSETGSSFKQALHFKDIGLNLHDTMIWAKKSYCPKNHNRYEQKFEYMFVLSKGAPSTFNGLRIPCVDAGKSITRETANKEVGSSFRKRNGKTIIKKDKLDNNVWEMSYSYSRYKHPAMFPLELVNRHILSWTNEGDTVLDCFMGSGTTGEGAKNLNRKFIGIEKDDKYFQIAKDRINQ